MSGRLKVKVKLDLVFFPRRRRRGSFARNTQNFFPWPTKINVVVVEEAAYARFSLFSPFSPLDASRYKLRFQLLPCSWQKQQLPSNARFHSEVIEPRIDATEFPFLKKTKELFLTCWWGSKSQKAIELKYNKRVYFLGILQCHSAI